MAGWDRRDGERLTDAATMLAELEALRARIAELEAENARLRGEDDDDGPDFKLAILRAEEIVQGLYIMRDVDPADLDALVAWRELGELMGWLETSPYEMRGLQPGEVPMSGAIPPNVPGRPRTKDEALANIYRALTIPGYLDHGEHTHPAVALQDVGTGCAACDAWWLAAAQAPAPPLTTAEMAEDAAVKRGDVIGEPEPIVPDLAPEPTLDDPRRPGLR